MTERFDEIEVKNHFDTEQDEQEMPSRQRREAPQRRASTHLDRLRAVFAKEVVTAPCNLVVPLRQGLSIDVEVEGLTVEVMENYSKQSTRNVGKSNRRMRRSGQSEEKLDQLQLSSLVLHNHCVGIRIDGELVEDERGVALTLEDRDILAMLNVASEEDVSAIMTEIFVMEIHVLNAFMELQEYLEDIAVGDDGENPLGK